MRGDTAMGEPGLMQTGAFRRPGSGMTVMGDLFDGSAAARERWMLLALAVFAFGWCGAAWRIPESTFTIDFRVFWYAGSLWLEGISPYDPGFGEGFEARVPRSDDKHPNLFYPPHAYWFATPMALIDYHPAAILWRLGLLAAMGAGAAIIYLAEPAETRQGKAPALFLAMTGLLIAFDSLEIVIYVGQTAPLIFVGIALIAYALQRGSSIAMVAGFTLVSLKPNLTLGLIPLLFLGPRPIQNFIILSGIAAVMFAPALAIGGLKTIGQYFAGLENYVPSNPSNGARHMTGVRHYVWLATGYDTSPTLLALVSAVVAPACGIAAARTVGRWMALPAPVAALVITLSISMVMVSMHDTDLVIYGVLLLLATRMSWAIGLVPVVAYLLMFASEWVVYHTDLFRHLYRHPGLNWDNLALFGLGVWVAGLLIAAAMKPGGIIQPWQPVRDALTGQRSPG
ncbi:MAG: glycosyltransferase 87 family protein [Pseudomonadota bacterium]